MRLALVAFGALGVSYLTTFISIPPIQRMAVSRRLLDFPDGGRHGHSRPVPRLGGVAIFAGLLAVLIASTGVSRSFAGIIPNAPRFTNGLIVASIGLFLVGLMDDLYGIRPIMKIAAQTIAAVILVSAGFTIQALSLPPHFRVELGVFTIPVTLFWLVGVSNAFNLIDGLDGLAGGVAAIALIATAAASVILGNPGALIYSVALLGAVLAFLRFNLPPARIFLGDSGSLVVGFFLAVLTVRGSLHRNGTVDALMPIFALSYPLLDTGMSILRRWLRGAPLSRADSRHIHHQLRSVGLGPGRAVAVIYVQAAIAAGLGLFVTFMPPAITVAIAGAGAAMLMFIMLYGVRRLNYHEFVVAQASVVSVLRNARTVVQDKINARDIAAWIGAASTIGEVEAIVANSASIFRFAHIAVTYEWSPPHVSASFAADQSRRIDFWTLQYPIAHEDSPVSVPLFLSISCSTGAARRPAGAERVAQILAPAIATWIGTKAELPTKSDVPVSVDWTPAIGPLPVDGSWPSFGNRRPREHSALAD